MYLLYKLCFIILFQENYSLKDTIHKKNLQFVENLKRDLRRNNDDYADLRRSFVKTNNSQPSLDNVNINDIRYKIITTRDNKKVTKPNPNNKTNSTSLKETAYINNSKIGTEDVRMKIIDNIRRKVNAALISKEVINANPQRRAEVVNENEAANGEPHNGDTVKDTLSLNINQPRQRYLWNDMHNLFIKNNEKKMRLFLNNSNQLPYLTTTTTTTTTKPTKTTKLKKNKKRVNRNKIENFKKFIHKNKDLLKEFISSKRQATGKTQTTTAIQKFMQKQSKFSIGRDINKILREATNDSNSIKSLMELPNAGVLDMFPAKGGRIHSKRVNGHLCQRHVLIPEGPKYNSLGRIYLPPHAAAHIAHEYNSTDVPKLLLPKCCNCCHKSVLGCE